MIEQRNTELWNQIKGGKLGKLIAGPCAVESRIQLEQTAAFLKERGIQVELFVRKNKDDKISKEFYYLGHMTASGNAKEFTMANTEKTAVEIEWILDVPVREDIYEYIVNA